jgi:hypothetical protein
VHKSVSVHLRDGDPLRWFPDQRCITFGEGSERVDVHLPHGAEADYIERLADLVTEARLVLDDDAQAISDEGSDRYEWERYDVDALDRTVGWEHTDTDPPGMPAWGGPQ